MVATSPRKRSRKIRLASMETLGFFDIPSTATTGSQPLTPIPRNFAHVDAQPNINDVDELWETTQLPDETLADWVPTATNRRLHGRNIRWGLLAVVFLIVAATSAGAYRVYQSSANAEMIAASLVTERASDLDFALSELEPVAKNLQSGDAISFGDKTAKILEVNEAARELFSASADLSSTDGSTRSVAADAATLSLDATQRVNDITAYRDALAPILLPPSFETDSSLVNLSAALQAFSEWRTRITDARGALPSDVATQTTERFDRFLSNLESLQRAYLDALRSGARSEADQVIVDIGDEIAAVASLLEDDVSTAGQRASDQIEDARSKLGLLVR